MSKNYERAYDFLQGADAVIQDGFEDEVRRVQSDMSEGLREAVAGGWLDQETADQMEYDWMVKWGRHDTE